MKLADLDVILAEASRLSNHRHFVLVGSLSVLGALVDPPEDMTLSVDADIFTKFDPGRVFEEIAHSMGENSDFHEKHGFYVDPISPKMLSVPEGWESRLLQIPLVSGTVAWCLDPNDAAASKLIRGEERDLRWVKSGLDNGVLDKGVIADRLRKITNVLSHAEIVLAEERLSKVSAPSCGPRP